MTHEQLNMLSDADMRNNTALGQKLASETTIGSLVGETEQATCECGRPLMPDQGSMCPHCICFNDFGC